MSSIEHRRQAALAGTTERRDVLTAALEVRSCGSTDELRLAGTPIVYGSPYTVRDSLGEFQETVRAGCMTKLLRGDELSTVLLVNHDMSALPLARYPSTMTFHDDSAGLHCEADAHSGRVATLHAGVQVTGGLHAGV